jgi:uncharacterized protein (DUF433 family)
VSYEPRLAAALSGATLRQLSHWRKATASRGPVLVPELSAARPILYSFRDVVALRICVRLRQEASLQKIRRALDTLRDGLDEQKHLSSYQLVAGDDTIYFVAPDHAVDLVRRRGNVVIHEMVDVLQPFYRNGRQIPNLLHPRNHLAVDPLIRGGEPVIEGTRIPASEVAALLKDGIPPESIKDFYPGVTPQAARDAADFTAYVDSYSDEGPRQAAS